MPRSKFPQRTTKSAKLFIDRDAEPIVSTPIHVLQYMFMDGNRPYTTPGNKPKWEWSSVIAHEDYDFVFKRLNKEMRKHGSRDRKGVWYRYRIITLSLEIAWPIKTKIVQKGDGDKREEILQPSLFGH